MSRTTRQKQLTGSPSLSRLSKKYFTDSPCNKTGRTSVILHYLTVISPALKAACEVAAHAEQIEQEAEMCAVVGHMCPESLIFTEAHECERRRDFLQHSDAARVQLLQAQTRGCRV